uniref:Glycoside hydrolase family 5 domain-containing protein n=1 Tax=Acrobeloides nanus TaxID=290746 RepID=A0A914C2E0_9BILA
MKFLFLVISCAAIVGAWYSQNPPYGQLKVTGKYVTKQDGTPVHLRGLSLYASDNPQGYHFFTNETMYKLKCYWNANAIRVPLAVEYNGYLKNPAEEYAKIHNVILIALANGLYVIVDWHAFATHQAEAVKFFANISSTFGSYPHILYELYNEPSWDLDWAQLKSYHSAIIDAIRVNDPNNIIVAATPRSDIDVDIAAADPLNYTNIVYTMHYYTNMPNTSIQKAETAISMGLPVFISEYGVCDAHDKNNLSYFSWALTDCDACLCALVNHANSSQVGDKTYWTESGAYINKKLWSTDQGLTCSVG